ncbi:MAG TPA: hypothetical protein VFN76_09965 [Candidatus Limnocylindria bacterium]|nr:hypothetical protein [Candidatus Limnocylindria bacterium]
MPLKAQVDKLDDVAEKYRPLYAEKDGKFVLDPDVAEDTSGIKGALDTERKAREAAERRLKAFDGIDPAKAKELEQAAAKAEEERQRAAGNFDALKAQMVEQHGKALDAERQKTTSREKYIHTLVAENVARAALQDVALSVDLVLPHVLGQVRVVEDESTGTWSAQIVDAKGNVRIKDGNGTPMAIADLVAEMRTDDRYKLAFKGSGASGSGAPADQSRGGGDVRTIRQGDSAAYQANIEDIAKGKVRVVA